jgi:hypothetical protein
MGIEIQIKFYKFAIEMNGGRSFQEVFSGGSLRTLAQKVPFNHRVSIQYPQRLGFGQRVIVHKNLYPT